MDKTRIAALFRGCFFPSTVKSMSMPLSRSPQEAHYAFPTIGTMKNALTLIGLFVLSCQLQAQVSFVLSSTLNVGNLPISVVAADVNGDGKPDLICVNGGDNTLIVLTNTNSSLRLHYSEEAGKEGHAEAISPEPA
jgi:FG-GAP repeat